MVEELKKSLLGILSVDDNDFKEANENFKLAKYQDCLNILFKAEKNHSEKKNLSILYNMMGECYDKLADFKNAFFYYKKSLDSNPDNSKANFNMGLFYKAERNPQVAVTYLRKAVELEEKNLDYLFNLAYILDEIGNFEESLAIYKKYEAIEPKSVGVLHNIGIIYCNKNVHDLEHEYYKRALAIKADYDYPYISAAVCYRKRKMLKEAMESANKAVEVSPSNYRSYEQRGYIYYDMGDFDKSKKDLEYSLSLNANNSAVKGILDRIATKSSNLNNKELSDFSPQDSNINFSSVAGMEEFKNWVKINIITPLKNPKLAQKYKKRFGGGVILYGPPGCGKTYFAGAIAGECKLKIIRVKISEILNMWIGNSEKNLQNLFETARKNAPCIIFLDEIDGLGGKRSDSSGGSKWLNILVNQLLAEMSDIDHNKEQILIIGATNMPWLIDDALKRSGRFGQMFYIPAPDKDARLELFKMYMKDLPLEKLVDFDKLASLTNGFAASDVMAICESASTSAFELAVKDGKERKITQKMLLDAVRNERSDITEWFSNVSKLLSEDELKELYPKLLDDLNNLKDSRSSNLKDKKMYG